MMSNDAGRHFPIPTRAPDLGDGTGKAPATAADVIVWATKRAENYEELREAGDFDGALDAVNRALAIYRESGFVELIKSKRNWLLTDDDRIHERALIAKYADALGCAGGLLRRLGNFRESLKSYKEGAELEADPLCAIRDTYNTVNHLVVQLEAAGLRASDIGGELKAAVERLRRDTRGARRGQSWAHADFGLCLLLSASGSGDSSEPLHEAEKAYRSFVDLAPLVDIESALRILRGLEKRLKSNDDPAAACIDRGAAVLLQMAKAKYRNSRLG